MSGSKVIASGFLWTTINNIINGIYGFISVPLLIEYYGKSNYGLIGLAMSVNVYLRLMDMGFNTTNLRFFSNWLAKGYLDRVNRLFQTSLAFYGIVGLLNALILLVVSFYSQSLFHLDAEQDVVLKHLFYILIISAIISWITSVYNQLISAHEMVGWYQMVSIFPKIAQIIILFITIYCGLEIESYYALTTFALFLTIPVFISKIREIAPYISFLPKLDVTTFKEVIPYSLNIFSFSFFQFTINYIRPVLLGIQGTIESVADYRVLNGVVGVVIMLGGSFLSVIMPSASKAVALRDKEAQNKIAYQGTKYITIALCFCCFGVISISPTLLTIYVGREYLYLTLWLDLWLATTLINHTQAVSSLILSQNNIRAITYATIVASVIGVVLCWFLVPYFGVGGTVLSYGTYGFVLLVFYYCYYWPKVMKLHSLKILSNAVLPSIVLALFPALAIRFLSDKLPVLNNYLNFILYGVIFAITYIILIWLITFSKEDKSFFRGLLRIK